eukprot:gene12595-12685_t
MSAIPTAAHQFLAKFSAILLELVYAGKAPKAIILHEPDAILLLGLIVAREMDYNTPAAYRLDKSHFNALHQKDIQIDAEGRMTMP